MTHSTHLSTIILSSSRQRQEFDPEALIDLANSITNNGLLHPIVVREVDSLLHLVAGERRLRAMATIWELGGSIRHNGDLYDPFQVPYTTLGELDPLAAEEAELDENLRREDLTWQEQSAAIARLHALRVAQASRLGEVHSITDTAAEVHPERNLDAARAETRRDIILAEHLENPAVAGAKTAGDALKILKRQEDMQKNKELAERVGRTFNSSVHQLHHADCLAWLQSCPENTFDVVLTDPPYGMGADGFGDGAGRLGNNEHNYSDTEETWRGVIRDFAPAIFRVTKPQAHSYIFCDIDRFHELRGIMQSAGWYVFRTPLINYKPRSGRVPLPENGPRRQYEICLYAIKGWKPVTAIYSDVITTELEESLSHGAQKPVALYTDLLRRSVRPGDSVLDPFAGTGTIFPAAHAMKVRATGIEKDAGYYGMAVQRLNALDDEPNMI